MVLGDDDITVGRMSVDLDESEFDAMLPREADVELEDDGEEIVAGSGKPAPFRSPVDSQFPIFASALRRFQSAAPKSRVYRIDTDETFGAFVCDKAVDELTWRVDELEHALQAHEEDPFAHAQHSTRQTVLGAAAAIADLSSAKTAGEAAAALPDVPLDLPEFARGCVKCWRDGEDVIVSIRFCSVSGEPRVATAAARPRADADAVAREAVAAGVDPVVVLGAVDDLAAVACGKRLLQDLAGAALQARSRLDVVGMSEPVLLASRGGESEAPLAALMYLEQRARAGDEGAAEEMRKIRLAASTPTGRRMAGPVLAEASRRLLAAGGGR